ncbi:unnamed protein product [Pedinophyceae sp. YPF-701]|nr:unnamed protein product [Pedinophyceae sp. YPF-701]
MSVLRREGRLVLKHFATMAVAPINTHTCAGLAAPREPRTGRLPVFFASLSLRARTGGKTAHQAWLRAPNERLPAPSCASRRPAERPLGADHKPATPPTAPHSALDTNSKRRASSVSAGNTATAALAEPNGSATRDPAPPACGSIQVICGPMFAGKTTELLRQVAQHEQAGRRVLLVKPAVDNRYAEGEVVSHDGLRRPCVAVRDLGEVWDLIDAGGVSGRYDVVAVDEAQFLRGLPGFCVEAAERYGMRVLVAGLDGDFLRRPFGDLTQLVPLADVVTRLAASCARCGERAPFSLRVAGGDGVEQVGGGESYMPVCRAHYVEATTSGDTSDSSGGEEATADD